MVHQPQYADHTLGSDALCQTFVHHSTPLHKPSRSDVRFPLSTPRRSRAPSITAITEMTHQNGQEMEKLTVRVKGATSGEPEETGKEAQAHEMTRSDAHHKLSRLAIEDLPLEVQGAVLGYIFGDLHSINAGSALLQAGAKSLSSAMRHPRRKAVSDLALVSPAWRDLVQERIYRHIKIKGTRAGLNESSQWFLENKHLTRHIRHIEFWVPVWGDKASMERPFDPTVPAPTGSRGFHYLASQANESLMQANELLGFNFKLSVYSSTLSEIFQHISCFFSEARVFTLEGGHCKKSNMIRHFPQTLFPDPNQTLQVLPNITTFAMRGAWNIIREHSHWTTIQNALPNVGEWHCAYAKPRPEAYTMISSILLRVPINLRYVNICLDGFYSKETMPLGPGGEAVHLCQRLGRIAPQLESLSYTGKICSCFWTAAAEALRKSRQEPRLRALEIVVKKCCRPTVTLHDPTTGEATLAMLDEVGSVMADGAGITNMAFIRAFERLTVASVRSLETFSYLNYIRIRFIDLDSPCALLNPYFELRRGKCYGLWNEEILDLLPKVRPGAEYEELGEGINPAWKKDDVVVGTIYPSPSMKPKAIKSSSYRVLSDSRG